MSDAAGLRRTLRGAKVWLDTLIESFDIDPATTNITVKAVGPNGECDLVTVNLAESLAAIDAESLAEVNG